MALPETFPTYPIHPARPQPVPGTITAPLPRAGLPVEALSRLPRLHAESRQALRHAALMARAVPAAGLLLAMGAVAALWGGAGLTSAFLWSLAVLAGICAVLRNHIRTTARLSGGTSDLRPFFLYLGFAWGMGAFLALEPATAPALIGFAALPALAMVLVLGDAPVALCFILPSGLLTAAAAFLRHGLFVAAVILALLAAIGFVLARGRFRPPA